MSYLLDASVVFAAACGEQATLARLARLEGADVATSAIVWSELMAAAPEKDRWLAENLRLIGETIDILPFDQANRGAQEAAAELQNPTAFDFVGPTAENSVAGQIEFMTNAPTSGYKVVMLSNNSGDQIVPSAEAAQAAGTKVVTWDSPIPSAAGESVFVAQVDFGSIGVVMDGFGFTGAMEKLGVERRVHTAGESKAILDPFQPEKKEDVERLLAIQSDVHDAFKRLVRESRKDKLKGEEKELFSGAFWSGRRALELGLIDGIGHLPDILERKFGRRVVIRTIQPFQGFGLKRFGLGAGAEAAEGLVEALETRALWARFGL